MKNLFLLSFIMFTTSVFGQTKEIEPTSIVKPEMENEVIDDSVFVGLEAFNDESDAVIYIYRTSSMAGAAAKWGVMVDDVLMANLKQKEYIAVHVNANDEFHYFSSPHGIFKFVNFKPNRYYYIKLKGFTMFTGYFNAETLSEFEMCKPTKPLR
ncbi:MAG: hypothetical protein JW894_01785 [Bacteroidales bacterium]|nr:hypothetical protein [Bacteroidales bacterium]